jgi:formamidopyrimidine-DNA glycosylase
MPELPEVESLRLSLVPLLLNQEIREVKVFKPKLVFGRGTKRLEDYNLATQFENELKGERILNIIRKAKKLYFILTNDKKIIVHLKMTGQLVYKYKDNITSGGHPINLLNQTLPNKHSHIIFTLEKGTLFYNDIRMFGYVILSKNHSSEEPEYKGIDPFDQEFTLEYFTSKLINQPGNIKKVFLEQKIVFGIGNIYSDEICFASKVIPTRLCKNITTKEAKIIYDKILMILNEAIDDGGSSIANYLLGDGTQGNYAKKHRVYGRSGKPCFVCQTKLEKIKISGRTTIYSYFI